MSLKDLLHGGDALRLPDFLGVGPPRTNTTWLDRMLRDHVGLPRGTKETRFFSQHYDKGLKWYAWHFAECPADAPVCEFCPSYFHLPEVKERVARVLPNCRIICTLRDPVERLYSSYRQARGLPGVKTFSDFLFRTEFAIGASRYATHLRRWFELFGRDNVIVLFNENLQVQPQHYLDAVCDFLEIGRIELSLRASRERINAPFSVPRSRLLGELSQSLIQKLQARRMYTVLHWCQCVPLWRAIRDSGREHDLIPPDIEKYLGQTFLPEIEELEQLLNQDLSRWKRAKPRQSQFCTKHSRLSAMPRADGGQSR
jgi:hypothetical protein